MDAEHERKSITIPKQLWREVRRLQFEKDLRSQTEAFCLALETGLKVLLGQPTDKK